MEGRKEKFCLFFFFFPQRYLPYLSTPCVGDVRHCTTVRRRSPVMAAHLEGQRQVETTWSQRKSIEMIVQISDEKMPS